MADTGGALGTMGDKAVYDLTAADIKRGSLHADSDKDTLNNIEKGELMTSVTVKEDHFLSHEDPFPEDEFAELETQQFTIRAVLCGCILGGVIAASNVYLGLKTGWTFSASLFGSIFGYALLKPISKLPAKMGGGFFGPKENVCCQSAATAAGSLGLIFTSGIPAAYQLGLLGKSPSEDFGRLVTLTLACAYYGMFFAIPLRKFYILKQKLVFPSAVAAAHTIKALHSGPHAEANARKKTRALIIAFCAAITLRCVSEYAPGIIWDWHWGWTLYSIGATSAIQIENWNWILEFTPAFTGVGMLTGLNASWSFFGGSVLAWGIIGPTLVHYKAAFGVPVSPDIPGYMNYMNMVLADPVNAPSPRYWMIWPGTMLLLCGSFAEVFANYKTLYYSFKQLLSPLFSRFGRRKSYIDQDKLIYDPVPASEQVPAWMWGGGIIISIIFSCAILGTQYKQNVGITIISIIFAFLFSFIGCESSGRTNIIPVTTVGNASQLVIGGVTAGHYPLKSAQLYNTTGGLLALGAAYQSADMVGDLKTTHLLRASPRVQFYAQCCGALVSIFMSVGMYVLFATAYPCINDLSLAAHCSFPAPDVGAWRAIAIAVTSPSIPIPASSGYTSIAFGIFAVILTAVKYKFIPVKYHVYVPNMNAVGIALILNATTYPTAMAIGSTFAYFWKRNNPGNFAMFCYAIAAGMIAGEGLGGIVGAVLQVAKVSGNLYGTAIGCPGGVYCG